MMKSPLSCRHCIRDSRLTVRVASGRVNDIKRAKSMTRDRLAVATLDKRERPKEAEEQQINCHRVTKVVGFILWVVGTFSSNFTASDPSKN